MMSSETLPSPIPAADPAWLASRIEEIIDPDLAIVDCHHHLWGAPRSQYLAEEFAVDVGSGHNVIATIFVACGESYRTEGPEELRPVGETEFAVRMAQTSDSGRFGPTKVCAGIVSRVDLALGAAAEAVFRAHIVAGGGRFKGARFSTNWDPNPEVGATTRTRQKGLLLDPKVREGVAVMAPLGMVLDTWVHFHQLDEIADLAEAFPETAIVVDHVGGPIGIGPYAGKRDEVYAIWRRGLERVARYPNVSMKIGGLGMRLPGFDFPDRPMPPSSEELAEAWRPFVEPCIELFGARRAMFESNFPVDNVSCSYAVLWNAFKRLAAGCSASERAALFSETARAVYDLDLC